MAKNDDRLDGFTLQQLLGAAPVSKSPKQLKKEAKAAKKAAGKRGLIATVVGAPFRLVGAIVKLPMKVLGAILKLPVRLVGLILSPFRKKTD